MNETKETAIRAAEEEQYVRACLCGKTDQRLVSYLVTTGFGVLSVGFYMYQLTNGADVSIYLALLTGTIGTFLPSPSLKK